MTPPRSQEPPFAPGDDPAVARARARLVATLREASRPNASASPNARSSRRRTGAIAGLAAAMVTLVVLAGSGRLSQAPASHVLPAGTLPLAHLTPGATVDIGLDALCAGLVPPPPPIGHHIRAEVVQKYRMAHVPAEAYELDYLITPELGGATVAANLWPEPYEGLRWNALVKDHLERLLPRLVCAGQVDLQTAQADIARDWVAAYRKYFGTSTPLPEYAEVIQGPTRESVRQSNTRKFFGPLFIMTTTPAGQRGNARLVASMPSVASAAVFTSNTTFE